MPHPDGSNEETAMKEILKYLCRFKGTKGGTEVPRDNWRRSCHCSKANEARKRIMWTGEKEQEKNSPTSPPALLCPTSTFHWPKANRKPEGK